MSQPRALVWGDVHIPFQDETAIRILLYSIAWLRPQQVVCVGDLLDFAYWSQHKRTFGQPLSVLEEDVHRAVSLWKAIQHVVPKAELVYLEGNHEARLYRWCAEQLAGDSIYETLSPQRRLEAELPSLLYIPYHRPSADKPLCYRLTERTIAIHAWVGGKYAASRHAEMGQGKSIIFGHTHRCQMEVRPLLDDPQRVCYGVSVGCLCKRQPFWKADPSGWVQGFAVVYSGEADDTIELKVVQNGRVIIRDGIGVRDTGYEPVGAQRFSPEQTERAREAAKLAKQAIAIWSSPLNGRRKNQEPITVSSKWGPY